ncbi:hypothetical protein MCG98_18260 [Ruminococcus sp. OA3]|uniref:hypothetical protein n=1 Tax=Ruminococcus sp. OA3 TaxID=2914164 RepID=UPI001F05F45D|nr:hypothetical protein [Ruminococcus sp. OA3]MCH1984500.1 hypothetical protein [Ruminococcus sp. OA3]
MHKIIFYELKKVFHKRTLLLFVGLGFLINALQLLYRIETPDEDGYSVREFSEVYEAYAGDGRTSSFFEHEIERKTLLLDEEFFQRDYTEIRVLEHMRQQAWQLEGYDTFLTDVAKRTEKMQKSRLFAQKGAYFYRNLQQTQEAYDTLTDVAVAADFDEGVLLYTDSRVTDVFCLLIVMVVGVQVFAADYESGAGALFRCMKRGHAELFFMKILAACMITFAIYALFYGTNYLLIDHIVGFGDTDRAIQSVVGYFTSAQRLSVGQYLQVFFLAKIVGAVTIGILFAAVCTVVRNSVLSIGIGTAIYGIAYLAHTKIPAYSWLGVLKMINLYPLDQVRYYFMEYENINVFSLPVSRFACGVVSVLLFMLLGTAAAFICYTKDIRIVLATPIRLGQAAAHYARRVRNRRRPKRSLLSYEMDKLFRINKGIFVMLFLVGFQLVNGITANYFIDSGEFYYRSYSDRLCGELTEEKDAYLEAEKERFAALETEREQYLVKYNHGEINQTELDYYLERLEADAARQNSFERVYEQYTSLRAREEEGAAVQYLYVTPWNLLFGPEAVRGTLLLYGIAAGVLILLFSSCGALEYSTGVEQLIQTSVVGKRGIWRRKFAIGLITSAVVSGITFLPQMVRIIRVFGLSGFDAPVSSYIPHSVLPEALTMGSYFIMHIVIRLIMMEAVMTGMLFLSERSKNRIVAIILGTLVFLVPVLILFVLLPSAYKL